MIPILKNWDYTGSLFIQRFIKKDSLRRIFVFFAHSGDSWFWYLGLILVYWLGKDFWKSRSLSAIIAITITALVVMVIKFTVRRKRPEGEWGNIYRKTDPHSFPSGHAARAFLLAILFIGLGPLWFGIILLIWAVLVAIARIALGVHYLSDIVVGALIGSVIAGILLVFPIITIL